MFVKIAVGNIDAIFLRHSRLVWECGKERKRSNTWFEFLCRDGSLNSPPGAVFASYRLIPHRSYLLSIPLPPGSKHVMLSTRSLFQGHLRCWRAAYKYAFPLCWVR